MVGSVFMENIKDYREKELKAYIIANILVILLFLNIFKLEGEVLSSGNISNILSSFVVSSCIFIFSFISDSAIGNKLKDRLVYLWSEYPGEKVFTSIAKKYDASTASFQTWVRKYKSEGADGLKPSTTNKKYSVELK